MFQVPKKLIAHFLLLPSIFNKPRKRSEAITMKSQCISYYKMVKGPKDLWVKLCGVEMLQWQQTSLHHTLTLCPKPALWSPLLPQIILTPKRINTNTVFKILKIIKVKPTWKNIEAANTNRQSYKRTWEYYRWRPSLYRRGDWGPEKQGELWPTVTASREWPTQRRSRVPRLPNDEKCWLSSVPLFVIRGL